MRTYPKFIAFLVALRGKPSSDRFEWFAKIASESFGFIVAANNKHAMFEISGDGLLANGSAIFGTVKIQEKNYVGIRIGMEIPQVLVDKYR
jgi:hypothetical protein